MPALRLVGEDPHRATHHQPDATAGVDGVGTGDAGLQRLAALDPQVEQRDSDVVATTGGDVAGWVRAEATLKAGLEPADRGRVVTALHPPVADHTAALARGVTGPVDERDAAVLLPRP